MPIRLHETKRQMRSGHSPMRRTTIILNPCKFSFSSFHFGPLLLTLVIHLETNLPN